MSKSAVAQRRPQDIRQQVERLGLILRQHGRVVDRLLFAREGIGVRADLVQFAIHVRGRTARRSLEDHVFQEMADAPQFVGLVA